MNTFAQSNYQVTRESLYRMIWEQPIKTVASEIGISDVALSKVCRKHGIPRPPRGHWAKKAANKKISKTPLAPRGLGMPWLIDLCPQSRRYLRQEADNGYDTLFIPPEPVFEETEDELLARVTKLVSTVSVPRNLDCAHRHIRSLLDQDAVRIQEAAGKQYVFDKPLFVSPYEQRRLRVVNAVFLALGRCGMKAHASGKDPDTFGVRIGEIHLSFSLDRSKYQRNGYRHTTDLNKPASTPLKMTINLWRHALDGYQHEWLDSKELKLERQLSQVVVNMIVLGELYCREHERHHRVYALERQEEAIQKRKREAQEREEHRLTAIREKEQARIDQLLGEADRFQQAETIRQYVKAVIRKTDEREDLAKKNINPWAIWALEQADRIDPTQNTAFGTIQQE